MNKNLDLAIQYFIERPSMLEKSAGKFTSGKIGKSIFSGETREFVLEAKDKARKLLCSVQNAELHNTIATLEDKVVKYEEDLKNNKAELLLNTANEIKTLDELIEKCKINTDIWEITKYVQNYWGNSNTPHWQVKAWLGKKEVTKDLDLQKSILISEIKQSIEDKSLIKSFYSLQEELTEFKNKTNSKLLEISIPDLHVGKMSHREEVGEDYDLKIATERYRTAITSLLKNANLDEVSDILLPIGNDFLNVDNQFNTTYGGTPQDCDTRYSKMIKTAKELLVDTITGLSSLAKVHVVIVAGNHDTSSMFMIGEILDAWFHNNPNVNVNNSPSLRKYFKWGLNGFQYTHGNNEKHQDLGLIFATENAKLWADTKYRFAKLGHFHKSKTIQYTSVDSFQGFQVQILPSLSGSDYWHNSKGYMSNKQAKAFLYDKEQGEVAQYTYTV